MKDMKQKVFWSDLSRISNKCIFVVTDDDLIHVPDKLHEGERGFCVPSLEILHPSDLPEYAVITLIPNRATSYEDFLITFVHELIHVWLYLKGEFHHDEEWIDREAERIVELERRSVERKLFKLLPSLREILTNQK